jgi:hypothetical protein
LEETLDIPVERALDTPVERILEIAVSSPSSSSPPNFRNADARPPGGAAVVRRAFSCATWRPLATTSEAHAIEHLSSLNVESLERKKTARSLADPKKGEFGFFSSRA